MPRSIPANPSVRFLQKEAKDILNAHKAGNKSCCPTLRYHFRFSRSSDEEILQSKVSLQEVQHALALDYGFKGWNEMKARVETGGGSRDITEVPSGARELAMQIAFGKLGEMLRSGIPFLQAIATCSDECKDRDIAKAFRAIHERTERREDIADILTEFGDLFPKSVQLMWKAGCSGNSGQNHLPECCRRIATILAEGGEQSTEGVITGPADEAITEMLAIAVKDRASDVHVEPMANEIKIRYRVDGVLYEMKPMSSGSGRDVIDGIMRMSKMNLAKKDYPQDSRMLIDVEGRRIDIRVNVTPGIHGGVVAMRILDRTQINLSLDRLNMEPDQLELYKQQIHKPSGLILFAGPTGCGKTTSLYATLMALNDTRRKIVTVEDPVEFELDGIDQIPLRPTIGLGFEPVLRSVLRQAPNVIMAGEIRNLQTAQLLVQAAFTGHLVFSTLHTNECIGTLTRLLDMGLAAHMLTDSVICVVAQRLVRSICKNCKTEYRPGSDEFASLQINGPDREMSLYHGTGCDDCNGTGYKGRSGVYSIMPMTRDIIERTLAKDIAGIEIAARESGWTTLREAAIRKMLRGETTPEEVIKFT